MRRALWLLLAVGALVAAAPAGAHETKTLGSLTMTIGWAAEPAYGGVPNSVDVTFANVAGAPVVDAAATLTVEIVFGTERLTLPLAAASRAGLYQATFVPTRAGAYSFHVAGRIIGQVIDTTSTCSGQTFDCVTDAAELQFPAKDPPSGQLLTRLDRERARADDSARDATNARRLAVSAVVIAVVAVVISLRRGRRAS